MLLSQPILVSLTDALVLKRNQINPFFLPIIFQLLSIQLCIAILPHRPDSAVPRLKDKLLPPCCVTIQRCSIIISCLCEKCYCHQGVHETDRMRTVRESCNLKTDSAKAFMAQFFLYKPDMRYRINDCSVRSRLRNDRSCFIVWYDRFIIQRI